MDLTYLPVLVTEQIFSLLPVEDLLTCSFVSSRWREAVNTNRIWRRHCKLELDLKNMPCNVSPGFTLPPSGCEDLDPLCDYRVAYMREHHLRQNVLHNRYSECEIVKCNAYAPEFKLINKHMIVRTDSTLHVLDTEQDMIEVDRTAFLLQEKNIDVFKSARNLIVLVQQDLLQVFSVVEGSLTFITCRVLDKEEAFSLTIPKVDIRSLVSRNELEAWYNIHNTITSSQISCDVADKYVVTVTTAQRSYNQTMHIWDIESGRKIKTEPVPELVVESHVVFVQCYLRENSLIIVLHILPNLSEGQGHCMRIGRIMSFRLDALETPEFWVEAMDYNRAYFAGSSIVLLPDFIVDTRRYKIIDTTRGEEVLTRPVAHTINSVTAGTHGPLLAFRCGWNVILLNTDTQQEFTVLKIHEDSKHLTFLEFMNTEFLVVCKWSPGYTHRELWDLKTSRKMHTTTDNALGCSTKTKFSFLKIFSVYYFDNSTTFRVISYW